jgi:hypothetical protein
MGPYDQASGILKPQNQKHQSIVQNKDPMQTNRDIQKRLATASIHSASTNEEKVDLINSKLGFDKNYTWFKVGQGMFTTLWLGISRTNVTILNKDKSEEIGNYSRSEFTVISSTSNR